MTKIARVKGRDDKLVRTQHIVCVRGASARYDTLVDDADRLVELELRSLDEVRQVRLEERLLPHAFRDDHGKRRWDCVGKISP